MMKTGTSMNKTENKETDLKCIIRGHELKMLC